MSSLYEMARQGITGRVSGPFVWSAIYLSVGLGLHKKASKRLLRNASKRLLRLASKRLLRLASKRLLRGDAGWSSPVARQAHNLKVTGSNPVPATKLH